MNHIHSAHLALCRSPSFACGLRYEIQGGLRRDRGGPGLDAGLGRADLGVVFKQRIALTIVPACGYEFSPPPYAAWGAARGLAGDQCFVLWRDDFKFYTRAISRHTEELRTHGAGATDASTPFFTACPAESLVMQSGRALRHQAVA